MIQYYIKGLFSIILNIHCKLLTLKQYVIVQCDFFKELYFKKITVWVIFLIFNILNTK